MRSESCSFIWHPNVVRWYRFTPVEDSLGTMVRARVTALCTGLPEVEAEAAQHVGFTVRGKRFAWYLEDHHGDGRVALNCKAPPGRNSELAAEHPQRFFIPAYLGKRGWVGLYLDSERIDWDEVERLIVDAYRMTAPRRLSERL